MIPVMTGLNHSFRYSWKRKVQTVSCCQPGICKYREQLVENLWRDGFHLFQVNAVPIVRQRGLMVREQIGPVPFCGIGNSQSDKNGIAVTAFAVNVVRGQIFPVPFHQKSVRGGNMAVLFNQIPCAGQVVCAVKVGKKSIMVLLPAFFSVIASIFRISCFSSIENKHRERYDSAGLIFSW